MPHHSLSKAFAPIAKVLQQHVAFDCLHVNGTSLLDRPQFERPRALEDILRMLKGNRIQLSEAFPGRKGTQLFRRMAGLGMEGVVAKRLDSPYTPGARSPDWLKIPRRQRDEFLIAGLLASGGRITALILGERTGPGALSTRALLARG